MNKSSLPSFTPDHKKTACNQDFTLLQAICVVMGGFVLEFYRVEVQSLFFTLVLFTLNNSPLRMICSDMLSWSFVVRVARHWLVCRKN